jgi:hypothetical protein
MILARSFEAAATEILSLFLSSYSRHCLPRSLSQNWQSAAPPAMVPKEVRRHTEWSDEVVELALVRDFMNEVSVMSSRNKNDHESLNRSWMERKNNDEWMWLYERPIENSWSSRMLVDYHSLLINRQFD